MFTAVKRSFKRFYIYSGYFYPVSLWRNRERNTFTNSNHFAIKTVKINTRKEYPFPIPIYLYTSPYPKLQKRLYTISLLKEVKYWMTFYFFSFKLRGEFKSHCDLYWSIVTNKLYGRSPSTKIPGLTRFAQILKDPSLYPNFKIFVRDFLR